MATTRFGHLDDFTLKNSKVGIGTSDPTEALEVIGGSRSKDIKVTGIATFTSSSGFLNKKTSYNTDNIRIESGESGTLSGEVVVGAGLTMSVGTGATSGQGSIKSLKVSNTFTPPIGGTNDRPSAPQPGALFYNKDFRTIEYWDGNFWRQVDNTTRRGRGVFGGGGGSPTAASSIIQYVNIATAGNALNFGDLLDTRKYLHGCSSSTRGIFGAGGPSAYNVLEYITIPSEGNAIDFGDLTGNTLAGCMLSSSTRGIIHQSTNPTTNVISYIEISTIGNAVDFGDMKQGVRHGSQFASPTRGVICGGWREPQSANYSEFQSLTIASKGNATDFGSLAVVRRGQAGFSNSVRGIQGGGISNAVVTSMESLTIASGGDATVFGDLSLARRLEGGGCAGQTRGIFAGGYSPDTNVIESITIATGGNAQDFGDLSVLGMVGGLSDSHGGLGGF